MKSNITIIGAFITLVGLIGIFAHCFPPHDGDLAITGAIIFAAGLISERIGTNHQ